MPLMGLARILHVLNVVVTSMNEMLESLVDGLCTLSEPSVDVLHATHTHCITNDSGFTN